MTARSPRPLAALAGCLLILAVPLVGCLNRGNGSPAEEVGLYRNERLGFSMRPPVTWEWREDVANIPIVFLSPQEGPEDTFRENLNIGLEDLRGASVTLDQYERAATEKLAAIITDFTFLESEETTLGGEPARRISYDGVQGQYALRWVQTFSIHGETTYVLTLVGSADGVEAVRPQVDSATASFRFLR